MSKAVRICLERADELRNELLDEQYEGLLQSFRQSETVSETLDALLSQEHAVVQRVALSAPRERAKHLAPLPVRQRMLLLMAAVRYCLQAAAVLEGYGRHLENRPPDLTVISAAHQTLAHIYEDRRSLWPENASHTFQWVDG